jgi:hypothetical protein
VTPTQLDLVFPRGETLSRHVRRVSATPPRVWEALLDADLGASLLSKTLLALRGYGRRAFGNATGSFLERLERFGFTRLVEIPGREIVLGLAGRFWKPNGDLRSLKDRASFEAFAEEGCVKAAWNLRVEDTDGSSTNLSTETRIACFGPSARRKFRLYWAVVGPASGALRRSLLRSIADRAEHRPLPLRGSARS